MANMKEKLIGCIELLRPGWWPTCFFIGLTPGLLAIYVNTGSLDNFIQLKTVVWAFAYWASIVGIYVFNDLVGIEEDVIVNPKRPLPSKRVTKKLALILSIILLTLGLVIWWITFKNPLSSIVQLTCILVIAIYSSVFKNNILLGLGAGLIPIGVWIAFSPFNTITMALFFILFFWELTLDVPENILHFEGDVKIHPQTFAVKLGQKKFASIGLVFAIPTIFAILWLHFLLEISYVYLLFAIISSLILLYSQVSIRKDFKPMDLGRSLGLVMLSIFIINIGIIIYVITQSYL